MTDPKPPDEAETKGKFQGWMNEVLDARETKAAADAKAKADQEAADLEKRRTREPASVIRALLGM